MEKKVDEILDKKIKKAKSFTEALEVFKNHPVDKERLKEIITEQEELLKSLPPNY